MTVQEQIKSYILSLPDSKQSEFERLHKLILQIMPTCKLWFLDGKNEVGKVVSNPNIGYGNYTINYANGSSRDFYQIGLSANTAGISVYIMGIEDKTFLANTFKEKLGKATITGYCIKFKTINDINIEVLETAIKYGFKNS